MRRYATGTSVPVDRSRAEAEKVLTRYGATGFGYSWDIRDEVTPAKCDKCHGPPTHDCAAHSWAVVRERHDAREVVNVTFMLKKRTVRLEVPMPTEREAGSRAKLDAATRQRWRALVLVLKAKLEGVASGISTLEAEFLANMVMQNGLTVGQAILPRLSETCERGLLLPAAGETSR